MSVNRKPKQNPCFSTKTFDDLDLHPHLVSCLKSRLEAVRLTKVQESSIPILLQGQDALIKSCTGSGKTLAYAVPIVQKLREMNPKVQRSDGVYALIIVPTRELALQCFECFSKLTKAFTWIVPGYLIGGEKKKSEKARLRKGINILISTPGRLLDHMERTSCLSLSKILWLVIDEADKLLEQGFEEAVTKIISQCNKDRHSILLSATLSKGVENLAGMSLSDPVHIDVGTSAGKESGEFENLVVPNNLKQYVVIVPSKLRLAVISGFIIDNCVKGGFKALIFMCSQSSVNFHYSLFSGVLATLLQAREKKCKFYRLHGNMKQEERTEIFNSFKSAKEGVLLCTNVAARGLDLLHVDWIVQYSAPSSAEIYVHRVGRTARIGKKGNSLLFLLPSESNFAHLLEQHKISYDEILASKFLQSILLVNEVLSPKSKTTAEECATALHAKYENEVYSESILHDEAKEAFASYVQSYASYPKNIRHILPFKALHLGHVAKSFCLREAPSALGCNIPNAERPKQRKLSTKPQKRKMQVVISEYDSGLSALTHDFGRKPKRKKS
ncbi:probable ATP-dependent RNA helicase DDX31 [Stegodyphus dumicola]|uniref:probable ATP-dependent RNA helicase DDX31 n=1 Tax=Stegodyphus dumicola TaxID=202533 RepID=UPI0015B2749E|nr:probable ATP-dependent RNA helicase DDX31 [Stegodyphus dumicola]